jgi:hypothetical protein
MLKAAQCCDNRAVFAPRLRDQICNNMLPSLARCEDWPTVERKTRLVIVRRDSPHDLILGHCQAVRCRLGGQHGLRPSLGRTFDIAPDHPRQRPYPEDDDCNGPNTAIVGKGGQDDVPNCTCRRYSGYVSPPMAMTKPMARGSCRIRVARKMIPTDARQTTTTAA